MVVASIGVSPMSRLVVGVDEVVGEDDGDAGDGLVLDKYEGGGQAATAATEVVVVVAAKEERRRLPDGGDSRQVRSTVTVIEVGEELENMTKTGVDGDIPAPRKTTRRIPREFDERGWWSGPRFAALRPEGRYNGSRRVRATAGKPRGGGGDRILRHYDPKGWGSDGARIGATVGTASGGGGDRVPRLLRPMERYSCSGAQLCSHGDDLKRMSLGRL